MTSATVGHPPLLSIVIINHNYGRFLAEAIDSALSQDYPATEVVVVDDASADTSRTVIAGFANRIRTVFNTARQGHVGAVNAGYKAALGELILFLDADDKLYRGCASAAVAALQATDIKLQFQLDTIDSAGQDCRMPFPYFPDDLTPAAIRQQSLRFGVYPWTVSSGNIYRRLYLEQVMPINQRVIFRSPDGYLNKLAPLFGDVRCVRQVLGAYRVHGDNGWAQDRAAFRTEPIIRWLAFDRALEAAFDRCARARGIAVRPQAQRQSLQRVEYRLLACRFVPGQSPYATDRRLQLLAAGCTAASRAPNVSALGRISWAGWFIAIALLPASLTRLLFRTGRSQNRRGSVTRLLIRLSRGRADR